MDSDSWTTRLAAASRRYHSRSDLYYGGDDMDGDDESRPEFMCPFCAEDFDVVGLCCHIDEEHAVEANNRVCPVCAKRVGMDLVGHITMQHGNLLKVQRKRRYRKHGSNLSFSILKKELRNGNLQSLLRGSQYLVSSSNTEPDPLLSSFMCNLPEVDEPVRVQPRSSLETSSVKESSLEDSSERTIKEQLPLSEKDREERSEKCKFVQGLLLSTFLDDNL
ncbi:Protein DEHYDRATION-INDUCED 19 like [Actinidia chinensis var. chinensis]|uniref:Protein DEHYDRATION-INDUCED 19 like n=1 Tax=Actinidia chinensis var. chinensis TaxID=1590841 RepID=A0A2R6PJN0_ACTCC|nr:Protein DEHYDRATION-INDUCED 19 like [Actinidia chinensis var. chinensis]